MPNTKQKPVTLPPTEGTVTVEGRPDESIGLPGADVIEAVTGVPQLIPPEETVTIGADEGITAWLTNRKILGLWTNSAPKNSWINIQGLGWKRLFTGSDTTVVCMTMLAAHAREAGRNVNVRIEADNMVHEIYVW
jgi:hypothetical protein